MKILSIDFDGVLHSYTSGWKGAKCIPDPPVENAIDWLVSLLEPPEHMGIGPRFKDFDVQIFSSRSRYFFGRRAMKKWLMDEFEKAGYHRKYVERIKFPVFKPPAFLHIDDRCICFSGEFPSKAEMIAFKPYRTEKLP